MVIEVQANSRKKRFDDHRKTRNDGQVSGVADTVQAGAID